MGAEEVLDTKESVSIILTANILLNTHPAVRMCSPYVAENNIRGECTITLLCIVL